MASFETELEVSEAYFDTQLSPLVRSIVGEAAMRYGQSRYREGEHAAALGIAARIEAGETAEEIRVGAYKRAGLVPPVLTDTR